MPKCTIDGREVEVKAGTTVIQAAEMLGIHVPHFCWHPDLPVDGNCRMCLVEIEKMPKLQIACNTQVTEGMVVHTASEKAKEAHRTTLEFLLINHPIDCPVCDQAGECYLQDNYMAHGLYDSKVEVEDKVRKRKVVDLGPIMLDAERCVLCSRCLRFEREVTGTNSFAFVNRGDHTEITTFENRPITHDYAGNLADLCPVGALLSHDFRFKMRVWFLKSHESVCPGCSTGCNVFVDERDGEVQRLRPRRNAEVNRSWICDPGRALYKEIGLTTRVSGARVKGAASWEGASVDGALDRTAAALRAVGRASAFLATPQATNEDLFAFKALAEAVGGRLDFRVGDPHLKVRERIDHVLQRADRNPNTQGCLDQGLGRDGVAAILAACRAGEIGALVLQGPELLRVPEAVDAVAKVPFVAVMATHEGPELDRATVVLPAALWAEVDGTFTNCERRVQRLKAAVPAPGDARSRWELAGALLDRLGRPLGAATAREVFALAAKATPGRDGSWRAASWSASAGRWGPPRHARSSLSPRRRRRTTATSTTGRSAPRAGSCPSPGEPRRRSRPGPRRKGIMAATVVTVDRNLKPGVAPILMGFWVTLANFFRSLFLRQASTIQYPEEKRPVSGRYRGVHILTEREDGTPKCVACYMCATVCPAECIYIEAGERPEKAIEKYPTRFEIDLLRCVYCGFCVDACPEEAIIMSRENDLVGESRAELVIDRDRLMARGKVVEHGPGYRPVDHDVRRPVRIAALERLRTEHGIVPGMPGERTAR